MFNATYFTYNNRSFNQYDLKIVDFNDSSVNESSDISLVLSALKSPGNVRFFFGGISCDAPPRCEFSILRETPINANLRGSILSWLTGRHGYKPLRFSGGDTSDFTYYCIFTSVKSIWVNGYCYGFRLTAEFDSPYARGTATTVNFSTGTFTINLRNKSQLGDQYTYPIVNFTGSFLQIINTTDDANRYFTFSGLGNEETITVDNELRTIVSDAGGEKLSNFTSKNWLRLLEGNNSLSITSYGTGSIICPYYAMIGF